MTAFVLLYYDGEILNQFTILEKLGIVQSKFHIFQDKDVRVYTLTDFGIKVEKTRHEEKAAKRLYNSDPRRAGEV